MSDIIASNMILATESGRIIGDIPDLIPEDQKKLARSMSRAAALLISAAMPIKKSIEELVSQEPFSVGIYCALESVPVDYDCGKKLAESDESHWANIIKKNLPPKQQLKSGPGIAPAILGIALGVMGPVTNFNDREYGVLQAFVQAELDLRIGMIKTALICSAFAADDPLMNKRICKQKGDKNLQEAAAIALMTSSNEKHSWEDILKPGKMIYGIASPLVDYISERGRYG
jgi:hypothetical protein